MPHEIVFNRVLSEPTPEQEGQVQITVDGEAVWLVYAHGTNPRAEVARWVQAVYGEQWPSTAPSADPDLAGIQALLAIDPATWTNAQLRQGLVYLLRRELRRHGYA